MPGSPSGSRSRLLALVMLAWVPFALLWGLFNLISFDVAPIEAMISGFNAMGWAAVLGLGVWWLTRRLPWPERLRPGFYLQHIALGIVFSATWLLASSTTGLLFAGQSLAMLGRTMTQFLAWRMLTGLWLYGLIAGVAYALQIREALRAQEQAAMRAEALAVRAQLDALRARLNPHFFFNALHALSGLIHRDPAQADDALDRIGQLLRRTLATDSGRLVPLAEEWEFTSDYLDLERLRLGDRLRVATAIDPEVLACAVLPFSIQPLVENAVIHAIAPRSDGGTIRITAGRSNGTVRLTVSDDGPGPGGGPDGEGHGLNLLRRRLAAVYGSRARLETGPAAGGGFEARVEIPLDRA
ncbi:MAG: sensor histidine kinase [Gemmatimonadales bacterium]